MRIEHGATLSEVGTAQTSSSSGLRSFLLTVPRQHKLDSFEQLKKREISAHLNRVRSGDEIEGGYAFGRRYATPAGRLGASTRLKRKSGS